MQGLEELWSLRAVAVLQFQFRVGPGNFCCVHVSLVPVLGVVGEQKTKPTQHSVAVLRSLGLNPHLLACRSQDPLSPAVRDKLVSWMSTSHASGAVVGQHCNAPDEPSPARMSCMLHRADVMCVAPSHPGGPMRPAAGLWRWLTGLCMHRRRCSAR